MGNYLRREWSIQWNLAFNQPAAAGLTDKIWPNNPQFGCLTPGTIMLPPKHNTISVLDSFSKPKLGFWSTNFIHIPGWLQACVVRRKPFFKTGAPDVEVPVSVGSLKSCDKVLNWQIWNGQLGLLVRDLPSHNPCQVHETFCVPQECNNGPDRQEKVLTGSKVCSHRSLQGRVDLTVRCLVCWHPRTCVPNTSPWVAHRHSAQPHFPVATWNKGWHTSFWVSNTVFLKHLSLNFGMIRHWNAKRLETWPYHIQFEIHHVQWSFHHGRTLFDFVGGSIALIQRFSWEIWELRQPTDLAGTWTTMRTAKFHPNSIRWKNDELIRLYRCLTKLGHGSMGYACYARILNPIQGFKCSLNGSLYGLLSGVRCWAERLCWNAPVEWLGLSLVREPTVPGRCEQKAVPQYLTGRLEITTKKSIIILQINCIFIETWPSSRQQLDNRVTVVVIAWTLVLVWYGCCCWACLGGCPVASA